jgi:hypothetical protein
VETIELIVFHFTKWTANSGKISEIIFVGSFLHAIALGNVQGDRMKPVGRGK